MQTEGKSSYVFPSLRRTRVQTSTLAVAAASVTAMPQRQAGRRVERGQLRRTSLSMMPGSGSSGESSAALPSERRSSLPPMVGFKNFVVSDTPSTFPEYRNDKFGSGNVWDESASITSKGSFSGKFSAFSAEQDQPWGKNHSKTTAKHCEKDIHASHIAAAGASGTKDDDDGDDDSSKDNTPQQPSATKQPVSLGGSTTENVGAVLSESIHGFSDMEDPFPDTKERSNNFNSSLGDFGFDDDESLNEDDLFPEMNASFAGPVSLKSPTFAMSRMNQSMSALTPMRATARFSAPNFQSSSDINYNHNLFEESESSEIQGGFIDSLGDKGTHGGKTKSKSKKKSSSKKKKKKFVDLSSSSSTTSPISAAEFERVSKKRLEKVREKKKVLTASEFERISRKRLERMREKKKGVHFNKADEMHHGKNRKSKKSAHNDASEGSSVDSGEKKKSRKHRRARRTMNNIEPDNPLSAMVLEHFKRMQEQNAVTATNIIEKGTTKEVVS